MIQSLKQTKKIQFLQKNQNPKKTKKKTKTKISMQTKF